MRIKIMHVFHRVESIHITKVMELPCTSRLCVFVLCKMRVPYNVNDPHRQVYYYHS